MTARRLISVLSVALAASASVVAAQPNAKKAAPKAKKAPLAPAKASGSAAGSAKAAPDSATPASSAPAGSAASGSAASGAAPAEGSAVQMTEDPPPRDMNGTDENPDAPKTVNDVDAPPVVVVAPVITRSGYPIEETLRPITMPQNMSEVSLTPHAAVSPFTSSMALRARYGITSKIQLGLTYMLGGAFDDPATPTSTSVGLHSGKAVGLDVTVMLQDWIGIQAGIPVYISPLAISLALGAPIKFTFGDNFAIGGLDDLLNIRLNKFAPSFYNEQQNAINANDDLVNTIKSRGELRFSVYGVYQHQSNFAFIVRAGVQLEDFDTGKTDGCRAGCSTQFLHAGFKYSPRRYLDLGLQIGFDDLSQVGSFAPAGLLAFRI